MRYDLNKVKEMSEDELFDFACKFARNAAWKVCGPLMEHIDDEAPKKERLLTLIEDLDDILYTCERHHLV